MLLFLILFSFSQFSITLTQSTDRPDNLNCPETVITENGNFPLGATEPVDFPNLYHCEIQFQIQNGYALHFTATKSNETRLDAVSFQYPGTIQIFGESDADNSIEIFAPSGTAKAVINLDGYEGFLFLKWQYKYVGHLISIVYPIGELVKISMRNFEPVTFTTTERITAEVLDYDFNLLMFDGPDLNSDFIDQATDDHNPTGNSVTFVKYNSVDIQENIVLALKYSDVSNYSEWRLASSDDNFYLASGAAVTVVSDVAETYFSPQPSVIEYPDPDLPEEPMSLEIWKGAPGMSEMEMVLSYGNDTNYTNSSPQQVVSSMYTVISTGYQDYITISPEDNGWDNVYPGKTGSIISTSIWGEQNGTIDYNRTFESSSVVVFNFHVSFLEIETDQELLYIEIGSKEASDSPSTFSFIKKTQELFSRSVIGNYMTVTYSGNSQNSTSQRSKYRIDFEITEFTPRTTTTTDSISETTTNACCILKYLHLVFIILLIFTS